MSSTSSAVDRLMEEAARDDRNWFQKMFVDISGKAATTQICIGATTGWITGFALVKIGKMAALAIGGTIVFLEIANENGIVKIDWGKVEKEVDKVTDRVEEAVTGNKKSWMDKAERYVDRKIDTAEDFFGRKLKPRRWYTRFIGDETGVKFNSLHLFVMGFCGGLAIGVYAS
ncbi:FUN14 domain-containing protein 2 isoform X1 [Hermetia illucens]|nr:FUN14 domain-containing protein 2 isoform X1 [Hermetia illucens]XP_037919303.1 FUN14 domain-containing protein 2 isoform X1 [Hermetia illucens]